ncbi:HlyD family efflux transporter periplasmic adaptor subunit [Tissierella sp. MB52-C2]|uniref:HlyD family efflux transporter periplasmic adaptor subunit n=1 Tax=Tissierella sp. MB52-C2 TaxID=3070999 RepID=UPI00280ABF42|nr:HlyD family efflux transporter periplasmic adaptor subunit [Tissierella sp. MB52-C2]WMM26355.1 HlyD family efflux transporter periplasmic adaptor subunit [Tissierella sp. MB52-C2]
MNSKKFIKGINLFLGITLFLTFFSKTIYNFNLPTVTVVSLVGGKLLNTVEGTSQITYRDSYDIYAKKEGIVKDILIKPGDKVIKGQALIEFDLNEDYIEELTLDIRKKEQDIKLLNMKLNNLKSEDLTAEKGKIEKLNTEILDIKSEIERIEDGTYESLKKSEYEFNIDIAEKKLSDKKEQFNSGMTNKSELNEAENNLEIANMQYEQYIQSEKEAKNALLNDKQEQVNNLYEKTFSFEKENEYAIKDLRFQISDIESELSILDKKLEQETDDMTIEELTLNIRKKEQDIELLNMKLNNFESEDLMAEKREIRRLNDEISDIKSEIRRIEDGRYDSLKKSEYEFNIDIAEKKLRDKKEQFNSGMTDKSELNEAENSLEIANMQYKQYMQSEKEAKSSLLNDKQEQVNSLYEKTFSFEKENEYVMMDFRFQLNNSQAELSILNKKLEKEKNGKIIAEADGIIIGIECETGKLINKNDVLVQVKDMSSEFKTELVIDEEKLNLFHMESPVEIKVRGISETLTGEILSINPNGSEDDTRHKITIAIKDTSFQLAGRNADIKIKAESQLYNSIIPNDAVRKDTKGYYVLVLREENNVLGRNYIAHKTYVELIDTDNSLSAIRELSLFEPIIVTSTSPIDSGSRVKYEGIGDKE